MKPSIGTFHDDGAAVIDLPRLLETRMLIQANSGGGKSWAIRRLLEQTAGHVQQLVIDPEGEFATLREKHDYVIAAPHDGDALAHPKTAQILARRLLETGVSAILDIYDLKAHERQAFVRIFCDALVNAPKALWQPTLVVLDEAHVFCPEAGKAESASAVIDLATRGRKRGFALIAATQRLAKLHKDTAAELLNKLVGRTGLDVDVKRAADELGMTPREAMEKLRPLSAGEFFAFGPALSTSVRRLKVGDVKTTHPKAGDRTLKAPPKPTAAIVAVLPKLADLPKEAETEARSIEDLKRELAQARRELTQAKKQQPVTAPAADKTAARRDTSTIKRLNGVIEALMKFVVKISAEGFEKDSGVDPEALRKAIESAVGQATKAIDANLSTRAKTLEALQREAGRIIASAQKLLADQEVHIDLEVKPHAPFTVAPSKPSSVSRMSNGNGETLPIGEAAILRACIQYPDGLAREQLTTLTGYKRSSRDAYIARVAARGYVTTGDKIRVTEDGILAMPDAEPLPTGQALQEFWRERLPEGERKILDVLIEAYPESISRDSLDEPTGYKRSSRDAYLARLAAKELVSEAGRGMVLASETLF